MPEDWMPIRSFEDVKRLIVNDELGAVEYGFLNFDNRNKIYVGPKTSVSPENLTCMAPLSKTVHRGSFSKFLIILQKS